MIDCKGKKILFIIPSFEIGGAERQASNLASYYSEKGALVSVLTVNGSTDGPLYSYLQEKKVNCSTINIDIYFFTNFKNYFPTLSTIKFLKKLFSQVKEIKDVFKSIRPDIIFPFCYTPNLIANNFYDTTTSFCIWNQRDLGLPPFTYSYYEKKALQKTKKIVANSIAGAQYVSQSIHLALNQIQVITNAIVIPPAKVTRATFRKTLGLTEETVLITMIANFSTYKDHETVVKAMTHIANENCKLLLVGRYDGSEKNIKTQIEKLNLKDKILILPFSDDIAGIYQASDIAVHSSLSEGLPNSLLEAMACGLPTIASDIGSHRETLKDTPELLFEPKNSIDLGEKISMLANSKELRLKYGSQSKEKINTYYAIETVAQRYLQLAKAF